MIEYLEIFRNFRSFHFIVCPTDKEESPDLSDDDDLSSLSSDSEESRLTNGNQDDDDAEQALREWKPTGTSLGDWEQHTRVKNILTFPMMGWGCFQRKGRI